MLGQHVHYCPNPFICRMNIPDLTRAFRLSLTQGAVAQTDEDEDNAD